MARVKKNKKVLILFIIIALILIISCLLFSRHTNLTKISCGTLFFDKSKELLFLNDLLMWDTGANSSTIYAEDKDKISNKLRIGFVSSSDAYSKRQNTFCWYAPHFNIGEDMRIQHFFFSLIKNVPKEIKQRHNDAIGIIGMDVIGKANWVIDFNSDKIDVLPQNKIYETENSPQLIFKYKREMRPETQLNFSVCQMENVLIDAGYNDDIFLLESDIKEINKKYIPVDTLKDDSYGLHSTTPIVHTVYVYDTLMINALYFNNIRITEGSKRLIGFKFFKRFDKVFLNTKEKEFCFY
jgi:hypothetical protein